MEAVYYSEPAQINYMPLPDGRTDVWLRKNIEAGKDEEGNTCWTCDEISFRTSLSIEEIEENFDTIWENGGPDESSDDKSSATDQTDIDALRAELLIVEKSNLVMAAYIDDLLSIIGEEGETVTELYILMINNGIITINDIPERWKSAVKAALGEE